MHVLHMNTTHEEFINTLYASLNCSVHPPTHPHPLNTRWTADLSPQPPETVAARRHTRGRREAAPETREGGRGDAAAEEGGGAPAELLGA
jgi:hypothetical protein